MNQILESGSSRFDNVEQALEERATVFQLSELSETVESLVKKVSALEKENAELREARGRCGEGSKENPIEIVDSDGVPYESAEEEDPALVLHEEVLVCRQRFLYHYGYRTNCSGVLLNPLLQAFSRHPEMQGGNNLVVRC